MKIGYVGLEDLRQIRQFVGNSLAGGWVAIKHAHHRSFLEESRRSSGADAARSAGHQYSLAFQPSQRSLLKKSGRSGYLSARQPAIAIRAYCCGLTSSKR